MSSKKKQEEMAFNRQYSRFKLQIFFKNRQPITHYGQERTQYTVAQINFGHVQQVVLDRQKGLQDCINRIELCTELYGPYQTALIYDRRRDTKLPDGSIQNGKEILKYVDGKLTEWDDFILSPAEKIITTNVVIYQQNGKNKWRLVPVTVTTPAEIDFKTEVAKALADKK